MTARQLDFMPRSPASLGATARLARDDAPGTPALYGAHAIKIESQISELSTASAGSGGKAASQQVTKLSQCFSSEPHMAAHTRVSQPLLSPLVLTYAGRTC